MVTKQPSTIVNRTAARGERSVDGDLRVDAVEEVRGVGGARAIRGERGAGHDAMIAAGRVGGVSTSSLYLVTTSLYVQYVQYCGSRYKGGAHLPDASSALPANR